MKKIFSLVLAVVMVLSMGITAFAAEEDIVILYTNDVHTYINKDLGYDDIAGTKQKLIAGGNDVLLVDAGDHIQGTAYGSMDKGETIIKLMNAAGYDLATLGNHEFDYGMDGRIKVTDEWAEFPYVSCNFYNEKDGVIGDPVLDAYKVFEVGGKKVAIIGITTPESFTKSTPAYFQDSEGNYIYGIAGGEDGKALYDAVQAAIDAASAEADIVIALGHLGDDPSSQPWTSEEVIANTTGLDAFIDGHAHSTVVGKEVADKNGDKVLLTQTGEYFDRIGKMTISSDGTITTELLEGTTAEPDAAVAEIQNAWIAELDEKLGEVIGNTGNVTFDNYDANGQRLVRKMETNTGDFAADALYYLFDDMGLDVDIAIMNGGGVRNKAISGEISYKTCKEIHTFGNVACLQTVTGQQILDALEWGAKNSLASENGGFLHVSGNVSYKINPFIKSTVQADDKGVWTGAPTGDYKVYDVTIDGAPLDLTAEYNLAGYNYTLRDLGDGFAMFEGAVNVLDYVMEDYLVLANYVKSFEGGIVPDEYMEPQNRIGFKSYEDYAKAPTTAERDWNPYVKQAIDDFIATYGGTENAYVVFDFDNTTSIFDVEEQLAVYQLQVMAFAFTPEEMPAILATELGDLNEDRTDLGYGNGSYQDWIDDITAAYTYLYETYGPFTAAGLDAAAQATVQADAQWLEFATKMRAMYDLVYDAESPAVAYPWVLYWFTGMTEQEVYDLAKASHTYYGAVETSEVTWETAGAGTKVGPVSYTWTSGTGVSEQLKDLYRWLDEAGIDVWVCSASAIDPIRAAIDAYGLHDYVTGVIAMARTMDEDGRYVNSYDYETGYGWMIDEEGNWVKDNLALGAQTQGVGKVQAINNAILPKYEYVGPLAGFMDSTGDYNFCTEYANLKLVINFNRASRKVTDGGGVIAELAMYQRDVLGYKDLKTANDAGDTFYVLQGRDETGLRSLCASDWTLRYGKDEYLLFRNEDNFTQLDYMIDNAMTTKDIINTFAIKTAAEDSVIDIKYGFLSNYAGYHNIDNGELAPVEEPEEDRNVSDIVINMNGKTEGEANPETGASVFALAVIVAAAAVTLKK
ncbi:MAG: 5'-nucleotidase C-terminal domain-containing protein [Oscillospiraceae bacterium]|nr:5'-nucleotidase C-terminal domain-containing protein [Oscillospiraceae bacterium]